MKSVEEYRESIQSLDREVLIMGERVNDTVRHPLVRPSWNSVSLTYKLAQIPEHEELFKARSHLDGAEINRFTHIQQNRDDLQKKIQMLRVMGQLTASCFQRCAGLDALNTVYSVTHDIDREEGTSYHSRFRVFLKEVQEKDLVCDAAMTDPKGDRSLPPHQQPVEDLYLKVVDRQEDGVVVCGAKAHQTGALNSHEILVVPTGALREEDRDYAVSFAVPADTRGISYVYGRQPSDMRRMEGEAGDTGNPYFGGHEALILFDHVFVPHERIFMNGEYPFARLLVERFGNYHRCSYGGCKTGIGDVVIGAAANMADYHGIPRASHVRDKLVDMTHLNETLFACSLAACHRGYLLEAGNYMVDSLLANVCKLHVTRNPYEIARHAQDICGGIMVTLPSGKDFESEKLGGILKNYFQGVAEVTTEEKVKMVRLLENLTVGAGAASYLTESLHGAGSPQAQKIMIEREGNLEHKKKLARKLLEGSLLRG